MKKSYLIFLVLLVLVLLWVNLTHREQRNIFISPYPDGKNFAFSITDDPDFNKVWKIRPIYYFLDSIGVKTTIAVWVKNPVRSNGIPDTTGQFYYGDTCEIKNYLDFVRIFHRKGFEIALHTVSGGNDRRDVTIEGYETFKKLFGEYPKINIMHAENLENVYWGSKVIENKLIRQLVEYLYPKAKLPFSGEDTDSPYFWGDILKSKTKYVRLWGTEDINTLKFDPKMPYHDVKTPYVNYWFSFSDGSSPALFKKMITDKKIKKLAKERGTCIAYTHFASGFTHKNSDGKRIVDKEFEEKMRNLTSYKDGWFETVSTILDRLLAIKSVFVIESEGSFSVANMNEHEISGVTLLVRPGAEYTSEKQLFRANDEGEIVIDRLQAKEMRLFTGQGGLAGLPYHSEKRGIWEEYRILYERSKLLFKHRFFKKELS